MKMPENKVKLIYITSPSRSGSTLLSLLLDSHSQICSIGEAGKMLKIYANLLRTKEYCLKYGYTMSNECTCGAEDIYNCPFWSIINEKYQEKYGEQLKDIDLQSRDQDFYSSNLNFFRTIQEVSQSTYILDSSKDIFRLKKLYNIEKLDVYPIVLIRNPKAQAYSLIRYYKTIKYTTSKTIKQIIKDYTKHYLKTYKFLKDRKYLIVHYEELVKHPKIELKRIMKFLELEFEDNQLNWGKTVHHAIGGNQMGFKTGKPNSSNDIFIDYSWKKALTLKQKLFIDFMTLPINIYNTAKLNKKNLKPSF